MTNGNGCEVVAFESTGNYWIPIFTFLEGDIELIVGNAYQIKHIPGRKTDLRDSEWIAELCLNGMINPFPDILEILFPSICQHPIKVELQD